MTHRGIALEVFSTGPGAAQQNFGSELADLQLESYERGYAAGWEDCDAKVQQVSADLRDSMIDALRTAIGTHSTIAAQCAAKAAAMVSVFLDRMTMPIRDTVLATALEDSLKSHVQTDADWMLTLIADPELQTRLSERLRDKLQGVSVLAAVPDTSSQIEMFGPENGVHLDLEDIEQRIDALVRVFARRSDLDPIDPPTSHFNEGP